MKKFIITLTMILVLTSVAYSTEKGLIKEVFYNVKIGTEQAEFENPIYERDDRVYVSIRDISNELGIPINWDDEENTIVLNPNNKKICVSDKTQNKEEVIPDKETALAVGKILLEKYADRPMEYETKCKRYYLYVSDMKAHNEWHVHQTFDYKDGTDYVAGDNAVPVIALNKSTGEVTYISTYADKWFYEDVAGIYVKQNIKER